MKILKIAQKSLRQQSRDRLGLALTVLMAPLFVGGAMNLVWIAGLTLLVLVEKLVARGFLCPGFLFHDRCLHRTTSQCALCRWPLILHPINTCHTLLPSKQIAS